MILYEQLPTDHSEYLDKSKQIIISAGGYTVIDFEKPIKKKGKISFQMAITTRMAFTKNILTLLGVKEEFEDRWLTLGPHIGNKIITSPSKDKGILYLYIKQLSKSKHLIDGVYTNCLCMIPLTTNQTVIQYTPKNLVFLPLEYPTRYLDFKLLDENGVKVEVKHITLQILNKHG